MNPASPRKQTIHFSSRLALASIAGALALTLFGFAAAPTTRAALPESEVKLAGAIPLTTELLEKMEKFLTTEKSDAAAKAELAAVTKENKDNPPMTGEAWGSLITAKCPKVVAVFESVGLTPEEFTSSRFTRLKRIRELLDAGVIDELLRLQPAATGAEGVA